MPKIPKPQKQAKQTEIENDGTWEVEGEIFMPEDLPEDELRRRNAELSEVTRQWDAKLSERKALNGELNKQINGLRERALALAQTTQDVAVKVTIAYDPTKKTKFIFHRGTEDLIRKEPMSKQELASGPVGAQQADAIEAAQEPPFRTAQEREQDEEFENA